MCSGSRILIWWSRYLDHTDEIGFFCCDCLALVDSPLTPCSDTGMHATNDAATRTPLVALRLAPGFTCRSSCSFNPRPAPKAGDGKSLIRPRVQDENTAPQHGQHADRVRGGRRDRGGARLRGTAAAGLALARTSTLRGSRSTCSPGPSSKRRYGRPARGPGAAHRRAAQPAGAPSASCGTSSLSRLRAPGSSSNCGRPLVPGSQLLLPTSGVATGRPSVNSSRKERFTNSGAPRM